MHGSHALAVAFALAAACCGDAAPGRPAAAPEAAPRSPHEAMLAALRRVRDRTADENAYQGDARIRELEGELEEPSVASDAARRFRVLTELGEGLVVHGRETEGLARLEEARGLLPALAGKMRPGAEAEFHLHHGAAWLRLAEVENCCARNTPESCILPLAGGAIHTRTQGSRSAIECFGRALAKDDVTPRDRLEAIWLSNIAAMTLDEYPAAVPEGRRIPSSYFASDEPFPRFPNVAKALGLDTSGLSGSVVADDLDGDDDLDLLVCTAEESREPVLFRNRGDGTFARETGEAGLAGLYGGLNMVQADYDDDGDVDVFVLRGGWFGSASPHPSSLLRNRGDGTFEDVTFAAGLASADLPTQTAVWADFDDDGNVDLYVGGESDAGRLCPCRLYRNEGDGGFTERAAAAGVAVNRYVKSVAAGDYDGDGRTDLYVSVLGGRNHLFRNLGDWRFEDVAPSLRVADPDSSFGAFFFDYDEDGTPDIFVSSYPAAIEDLAATALGEPCGVPPPKLFRGDGRGGFEDVSAAAGFTRPFSPMGHNFGDLDNDGFLDLYFATGAPQPAAIMPNLMFRNVGGRRFADVTLAGGFGNLQKGHGVAFADLDEDGDLDVFAQMGGAFLGDRANDCLFENPGFGNSWTSVRLEGRASNRSAVGARIRAEFTDAGVRRSVHRTVGSGGSFGCNPLRQHIGLGKAGVVETLEIRWPSTGRTQTFRDVAAAQIVTVVEGEDRLVARAPRTVRLGGGRR